MMAETDAIAQAFVTAHLGATALHAFPGIVPERLEEAYAIQDRAIALWRDQIAGWKVARIPPAVAARLGADRWIGPVFSTAIRQADEQITPFPIIPGGGGALEAEIMVVLGKDAPPREVPWTATAARSLVASVHVGIEIAGSAFAGNSALGAIAMTCGLGNSLGLIIGKTIEGRLEDDISCSVSIEGQIVGDRVVDAALNAPLEALAFVLDIAAARGFPLRAGQIVSTGAITGPHIFEIGQRGRVDFGRLGSIDCHAVPALKHRDLQLI